MITKYYSPDINEGGDDPKKVSKPEPPANYAPLKPEQRKQWNDFLDYVDKQGLGGSNKLDARDQNLGLGLMDKYRKLNPQFSITPDMIPQIQYDQFLLRKGDSYPTVTKEQLAYMRNGLNPAYMKREVSQPDGWFGSLTSKEYYPEAKRAKSTGEKYDFSVHFEDYLNSLKNPDLEQKYLVKNQ